MVREYEPLNMIFVTAKTAFRVEQPSASHVIASGFRLKNVFYIWIICEDLKKWRRILRSWGQPLRRHIWWKSAR